MEKSTAPASPARKKKNKGNDLLHCSLFHVFLRFHQTALEKPRAYPEQTQLFSELEYGTAKISCSRRSYECLQTESPPHSIALLRVWFLILSQSRSRERERKQNINTFQKTKVSNTRITHTMRIVLAASCVITCGRSRERFDHVSTWQCHNPCVPTWSDFTVSS